MTKGPDAKAPFSISDLNPFKSDADEKAANLRDMLLDVNTKIERFANEMRRQREANLRAATFTDTLDKGDWTEDSGGNKILRKDLVIRMAKEGQQQRGEAYVTFAQAMNEFLTICLALSAAVDAESKREYAYVLDKIGQIELGGLVPMVGAVGTEIGAQLKQQFRKWTKTETMTHSIHVDENGELKLDPLEAKGIILDPAKLDAKMDNNTKSDIEQSIKNLNDAFKETVKTWLSTCGYHEDNNNPGHYIDENNDPLTEDTLKLLQKYDPVKHNTTLDQYLKDNHVGEFITKTRPRL